MLSGDVDHRDKMLSESKLSATFGSTESMGTTAAEPQAAPEKKRRRADDALSVESEDETNAITSGPDSGGKKSHAKRSVEARARKMRRIISAGEHGRPLSITAKTIWR